VVETLGKKLLKAAKFFEVENIAVVGGVSANLRLKEYIQQNMEKF
jgi:tRNA A37 threonylcarbamoyltransferase TsaD